MLTRLRLPDGLVNNSGQNLHGAGELFTSGSVWYVDSVNGSDGNPGDGPGNGVAKATVAGALAVAKANNGDVIVCAPNHSETFGAGGLAINVAGVAIIGLGVGSQRATFNFSKAASSANVSSAGVKLSNLRFIATTAAVAQGVILGANRIVVDRCSFDVSASANYFRKAITINGFDASVILATEIIAPVVPAQAEVAISLDVCNNVIVEGCNVFGSFSTALINNPTSTANTGWQISENSFYNTETANGFVLKLVSSTKGIYAYNSLGTGSATGSTSTLGTATCLMGALIPVQNYISNSTAKSAVLILN